MVLIKTSYLSFKVSKIEINDGGKLESDKLKLKQLAKKEQYGNDGF